MCAPTCKWERQGAKKRGGANATGSLITKLVGGEERQAGERRAEGRQEREEGRGQAGERRAARKQMGNRKAERNHRRHIALTKRMVL